MAIAKDMSGMVFGKWSIVSRDQNVNKNVHWICRCACGVEQSVSGNHLRRKNSLSCRKCSEGKEKGRVNGRVWERIKYGATSRGLSVEVDRDYLYDLYLKQDKKCALTGLPISFAATIKEDRAGSTTASLDRIDSKLGYEKSNIHWVHKEINRMKWDLTLESFLFLCKSVADHHAPQA